MPEIFARPLFFRNLARTACLIVNAAFAVILLSIMVNDDKPQEAAIPVIRLLVLTMIGSCLAWRWEKTGAIMTAIGATGLGIAAYISAQSVGLAGFSFFAAALYGLPFLALSALFFTSYKARIKFIQ